MCCARAVRGAICCPGEYGPWPTVYYYLRRWRLEGTWEQIHPPLRELARERMGRDPTPSAAIIDSQSVKPTTTEQGGPHGFDGAKKINGRKRHLLVDTEGFVLKAVVHPANLHDRLGAKLVLGALGTAYPRLRHVWADQGYAGGALWGSGVASSSALTSRSSIRGGANSTAMRQEGWNRGATNLASTSCPGAGWSSAPSPGSGARRPTG